MLTLRLTSSTTSPGHEFEQPVLAHQVTGVLHEGDEQVECLSGDLDRPPATQQHSLARHEEKLPEPENRLLVALHARILLRFRRFAGKKQEIRRDTGLSARG
jgi:hypothetical protein